MQAVLNKHVWQRQAMVSPEEKEFVRVRKKPREKGEKQVGRMCHTSDHASRPFVKHLSSAPLLLRTWGTTEQVQTKGAGRLTSRTKHSLSLRERAFNSAN